MAKKRLIPSPGARPPKATARCRPQTWLRTESVWSWLHWVPQVPPRDWPRFPRPGVYHHFVVRQQGRLLAPKGTGNWEISVPPLLDWLRKVRCYRFARAWNSNIAPSKTCNTCCPSRHSKCQFQASRWLHFPLAEASIRWPCTLTISLWSHPTSPTSSISFSNSISVRAKLFLHVLSNLPSKLSILTVPQKASVLFTSWSDTPSVHAICWVCCINAWSWSLPCIIRVAFPRFDTCDAHMLRSRKHGNIRNPPAFTGNVWNRDC